MMRWRGALVPVALLLLWHVSVEASDSMAPPLAVLRAAVAALADGSLLAATAETLLVVGGGLLFGGGAGLLAGVALGLLPWAARLFRAPVEVLRPLPSVALIPLALLAFGFGPALGVSVVAFATFWPTLVLAEAAVRGVDRQLLDMARALQLGAVARVAKVVLPAAAPRLLVALRLAIGVALVVAVTVEIAVNPQGLGYVLTISQQSLRPDLMLACLFWVGLLGWSLNRGVLLLERRLFARSRLVPAEAA